MMTAEQVFAIRDQLVDEGAPKPEIIRQLALACLGWPYVFGAWGEACTRVNRKRRARSDHPTIESKCPALNGKTCVDCSWGIGVLMFDCRGWTHWLCDQVGITISGQGASSQYNTASNWVQRGKISDMPDVVCCVFRQKDGKMEHTGMHIGGDTVIDCSTGVSSVGMKGWTHYAIPNGLYSEEEIPVETVRPILRKGSTGEDVRKLQERLNELGYDCGAVDGKFGDNTRRAVIAFQGAHGLKTDGVVGTQTWAALDAGTDVERYRVVCDGVTLEQYHKILEICPLAEAEKV